MRPENAVMSQYLARQGLDDVVAHYYWHGSLTGCWRLHRQRRMWTEQDIATLDMLGFLAPNGAPLQICGGIGNWQVFVRGHNELLSVADGCDHV